MAAGKELRTKIKSVENTKKITKAMEMISVSKMRKAQERMRAARPYSTKIRDIATNLGIRLGSAAVGRFSDGEVTVEISIAASGEVTNVSVVRSQPRGTFDREVLNTVRDWRFEPMDGPATVTRTFTFRP